MGHLIGWGLDRTNKREKDNQFFFSLSGTFLFLPLDIKNKGLVSEFQDLH
jgi:hypothetical protein